MKDSENKKVSILAGESARVQNGGLPGNGNKAEKLKKPLLFALMGIAFIGCMYLIFKPSSGKKESGNIGLNDAVPQATNAGMPADKGKAYEQEMLESKAREKQSGLTALSDYWNTEDTGDTTGNAAESGEKETAKSGNPALSSYRNMQSTLGSFYHDGQSETRELRRQLDELKEKLADKEAPAPVTVNDQLALMEKSYQMAAKYLPGGNAGGSPAAGDSITDNGVPSPKESLTAVMPVRKNVVSALYREPSDSAFLEDVTGERNRGFYTAAGAAEQPARPRNGIRACVQETQAVTGDGAVKLRLLEAAKMPGLTVPAGTIITANAKPGNNRLQLKVSFIEIEGNIIPVDISVYDLDGQPGLNVPYSPERNALTDIIANMGSATGSSFSMSSSTGQQIASDLSKSAVQGISGYFAKKVRTPKVSLKAGYRVFLVSKK